MHYRPLALVSVLTVGDYALWNWSLQGAHDVPALVSGLSLPPLAIALVWLLALNAARLLAQSARRPSIASSARVARRRAPRSGDRAVHAGESSHGGGPPTHSREGQEAPPSKLAA